MEIIYKPIGIVHSPFQQKEDINKSRNIDPKGFEDIRGELEIYEDFAVGLQDLDGFSHIILIFAFHKAKEKRLYAHPPYDDKRRGIFATRSPSRPNPVGLTVLRLIKRDKNNLQVQGVDIIEGTPILDIKPYTARDQKTDARFGWLEKWLD
jgi:tRNA-Thr(GGU) m(6)t(6)A37 methyltransferase TsaA